MVSKKISVQSPQNTWLKNIKFLKIINKISNDKNFFKKIKFISQSKIKNYLMNLEKNDSFTLPLWQLINLYYICKLFK